MGFGFSKTRLGLETCNRDQKATISRQFETDKDTLWGGGLRAPIGNRVARAAASLTWGTLTPDRHGGDSITWADCAPYSYEAYDAFCTRWGEIWNARETTANDRYVRAGGQAARRIGRPIFRARAPSGEIISDFNPSSNPRGSTRCAPVKFHRVALGGHGIPVFFGAHGRNEPAVTHVAIQRLETEYRRNALSPG